VKISNQVESVAGAGLYQICDLAAFDVDSPAYHVDPTAANANYPAYNTQYQGNLNCQSFAFN
jgi:hypothetical protein